MALELSELRSLLDSARKGERRSLAKLLTEIERGQKIEIPNEEPWILGVTGAPGVGKSTLIGRMISHWHSNGEKVAVLAVDPSSPISGGSLMADRVRMPHSDSSDSVYVRSLASQNFPGGILPHIDTMCRALSACGWHRIIIETVGSGQSEISIVAFSDVVLLVEGPDRGDIIQAEKAGVLEIADAIVINKSDIPSSASALEDIRRSLELSEDDNRVVRSVSAINGDGIAELISEIENIEKDPSRSRIRNRERLISHWVSLLITHERIESNLEKLSNGSITINDAIDSIGNSLNFGGN